jgi:hypothetical protein
MMLRNIRFGAVQAGAGHGADLHGEQQQMSHIHRGMSKLARHAATATCPTMRGAQLRCSPIKTSATWGLVMIQWAGSRANTAYLLASWAGARVGIPGGVPGETSPRRAARAAAGLAGACPLQKPFKLKCAQRKRKKETKARRGHGGAMRNKARALRLGLPWRHTSRRGRGTPSRRAWRRGAACWHHARGHIRLQQNNETSGLTSLRENRSAR